MEDLFRATGASVRVGYLDGMRVAYLEKTSAHVPVSDVRSARLPVHATALGKALLAFPRHGWWRRSLPCSFGNTRHGP